LQASAHLRRRTLAGARYLERMAKDLQELSETAVYVGVPKDAPDYPDGTSVVKVAIINEFGAPSKNIPPRPFVSASVREHGGYRAELSQIAKQVTQRKVTPYRAMQRLGMIAQANMRKYITALMRPPNAAATIAKKGFNNPLIETGHLRRIINYLVKRGERG